MDTRAPLELADDLCIYSVNVLNRESPIMLPLSSDKQNLLPSALKPEIHSPRGKKIALKEQQKILTQKYKKVKQMTIDYYCREDLTITTLKEFFEIFISSLKKD